MRFYYVYDTHKLCYEGTLAAAHKKAREEFSRFDVTIEEVEVGTDKPNMLRLLNAEGGFVENAALRQWELTPRGGLLLVPATPAAPLGDPS